MNFLFRAPVFPVVFRLDGNAVCALNKADLERYLRKHAPKDREMRELIDSRWEGFSLYPDKLFVSPLALKKKYTKKELLLFCGVSEEHLLRTDLDRYTKEQIFAYVVNQSQGKA